MSGDPLRLSDDRADTLTEYLRVLRDTNPRVFLLENVYGLAYKGKDEGLRHILEGIDQINNVAGTSYSVSWKMLNAAHFGVPAGPGAGVPRREPRWQRISVPKAHAHRTRGAGPL